MKKRNTMAWYLAVLMGVFGISILGCSEMEDAADDTGDAIENAADETGDAVEKAADKTGDAVENAADEIDQEM